MLKVTHHENGDDAEKGRQSDHVLGPVPAGNHLEGERVWGVRVDILLTSMVRRVMWAPCNIQQVSKNSRFSSDVESEEKLDNCNL